jgi:hypothetical protein
MLAPLILVALIGVAGIFVLKEVHEIEESPGFNILGIGGLAVVAIFLIKALRD